MQLYRENSTSSVNSEINIAKWTSYFGIARLYYCINTDSKERSTQFLPTNIPARTYKMKKWHAPFNVIRITVIKMFDVRLVHCTSHINVCVCMCTSR